MMESWIGGQKRSLASLLLMEAHQARLHQTHRTFPMMMTVTQHIPTMTDSHHGGFLSVMIMVGICQVTNSHHK